MIGAFSDTVEKVDPVSRPFQHGDRACELTQN
jgi:hypothetical protein